MIEKTLGPKDGKESRAERALKLKKRRVVFFLDTKEGLFARRGIALRSRTYFKNGALSGLPELTLKFRTPDLLRAVEYRDAAMKSKGATVLEEDIAPFQVFRKGRPAIVAKPRSTYSRFSVSTKRDLDDRFNRLDDVFARFGALSDLLDEDGKKADEKLRPGPTICEWVFQICATSTSATTRRGVRFHALAFPQAGSEAAIPSAVTNPAV